MSSPQRRRGPLSHAEGDVRRAPVWEHFLHKGEEPRSGVHARQHGGSETVPPAGHQRHGVHPSHPHAEDQSGSGVRSEGPNKRTGTRHSPGPRALLAAGTQKKKILDSVLAVLYTEAVLHTRLRSAVAYSDVAALRRMRAPIVEAHSKLDDTNLRKRRR